LIYKPDIIHWFKRRLKINVSYLDEYDQFRITAHTRYAMSILSSVNTTKDSAALLINVTV
jgi:hypothetical protein